MGLELRAFGPLTISVDGVEVRMTSRLRQVLLAVLLANRGRVVPVSTLVGTMWTSQSPATAARRLHIHIHRLRRALGDPAAVRHSPAGYALVAALDQVDIYRFAELTRRGHAALAAGDQLAARDLLREALALCRGPAFQGLDDIPSLATEAEHLAELRLVAIEGRIAAELAQGEHMSVVAELRQLVADHPLRERLRAQLMTALYRAGRKADALAIFRDGRRILVEELGIEPSPESRELERAILVDDPGLAPSHRPAEAARAVDPLPPVPRQLPADLTTFTGRTAELRELDALVSGTGGGSPATIVVISAIHGTAGIGKTALAVRAAHRLAERCPDGQLFIDLHGFTPAVSPVEPGQALDRLLRALGVPGQRIPVDMDDRAGLWRSTLAGRCMLLVLDNAATEVQVEPLLPGAPGCLVLVTSRRRLTGLAATHIMPLDTLPLADALTLFRRTAGPGRLTQQPVELVAETVELCGRLPLAIRLAAARLRSRPTWSVADLVERLRDRGQRLAELGEGPRGVAAALDLSYQQLTADQQRMYRLLGLHPGPDFDPYAAAALAGTSRVQAGRLLDQLLDAHLLHEPAAGRCVFHDLVRTHATSTALDQDAEHERRAALTRLLDHYRHSATVAMDVAYPYERERRPDVPPADTPTPALPDPARALGWLDVELPNLLAAAQHAADAGWPAHTGHLSAILHRHLRTRGRYHEAEQLHHRALTATAGTVGEIDASNGLGWIYRLRGWHDLAIGHFASALDRARAIGHRAGELDALNGLGSVHLRQGRYDLAIGRFAATLEVARAVGHRAGELDAVIGLGCVHRRQGRYDLATDYLNQGLQAARATDNRVAELQALRDLGTIHRFHGRHRQAAEHYARMLEIALLTGNPAGELDARNRLGNAYRAQGRYRQAVEHYARLLEIARGTGSRTAELVAMLDLGHTYLMQGKHPAAAAAYQHALDIGHEIGDRDGRFEALQGLGRLHHATGHQDLALAHHQQALELATDLQQPPDEARAHDGLAHAHHALNQSAPARQHWQRALDILTRLGIDYTDDEEATVPTISAHLAEAPEPEPA